LLQAWTKSSLADAEAISSPGRRVSRRSAPIATGTCLEVDHVVRLVSHFSELGSGANRTGGTRLQIHSPHRLSHGPYFRPIVESGAATRSYPVESGVTL
jgi:hypothetical protein